MWEEQRENERDLESFEDRRALKRHQRDDPSRGETKVPRQIGQRVCRINKEKLVGLEREEKREGDSLRFSLSHLCFSLELFLPSLISSSAYHRNQDQLGLSNV